MSMGTVTMLHLSKPPWFCCMFLCVCSYKLTKSQFYFTSVIPQMVICSLRLHLICRCVKDSVISSLLFSFCWSIKVIIGTNGPWICMSKISGIPHIWYTCTNTYFSYTTIYEHTNKIVLTDNDKINQIHNIKTKGGGIRLLAYREFMKSLSQTAFWMPLQLTKSKALLSFTCFSKLR